MLIGYLKYARPGRRSVSAVLGLFLPLVVAACSSDSGIGTPGSGGSGGSRATGGSAGSTTSGGAAGSTGGAAGSTTSGGAAGSGGATGGTAGKGGSAGATGGSGGSAGGGAGSGGSTGGTGGTVDGGAGKGGTAGAAGSGGTGGATDGGTTGGAAGTGGMTDGGGGTGGGGSDGGVVVIPPGDPITPVDLTWKAVPTDGTICRNKSATGFAVNLNAASDKVLIYMEGGGACFNGLTCVQNPTEWAATDANAAKAGSAFVLDRTKPGNPFKDWNMIYIPYCTGDVHTGTNMAGYQGQPQMGYSNYLKYLGRIVATLKGKSLSQVVLSGISAGGFGVAWNWMTTQDAFPGVPVSALDDSGPPFGSDLMPPCFQQKTAALWGWSGSIHPACGAACDVAAGNVVAPLMEASMRRQTTRFGLLSYDEDGTIKTFLSFGQNNCANWELGVALANGAYPAGLADIRTRWMSNSNAAQYVYVGKSHTYLGSQQHQHARVGDEIRQQRHGLDERQSLSDSLGVESLQVAAAWRRAMTLCRCS
jgi:hypothetical protein